VFINNRALVKKNKKIIKGNGPEEKIKTQDFLNTKSKIFPVL
jgi:hypothetical protein